MRIAFKNTSNITFASDLLLLYPFKLFFLISIVITINYVRENEGGRNNKNNPGKLA